MEGKGGEEAEMLGQVLSRDRRASRVGQGGSQNRMEDSIVG